MKRSKARKTIFTLILCAMITIAGIGAEACAVKAAGKAVPLKVGFCGTAVNLLRDLNGDWDDTPTFAALKKKWGTPSKKTNSYTTYYTWKKGKTSIKIGADPERGGVGSINISIKDTNGSLCGVKVGMKQATALKKLQNALGAKRAVLVKEGQEPVYNDDFTLSVEGKATGDGAYILASPGGYAPISVQLKNGKVTSITWFRS